jgi:uracil DNA glycosylase
MAPKIIVNNRMEEVKADGYNVILQADHPAAGSYGDSKYNFSGCNHFSICNEILKAKGQTIINW